jgi:hypothetical protein
MWQFHNGENWWGSTVVVLAKVVMLSPYSYSSTLTVGITRIVWLLCKKRRQRDEERAMVCGGVCAGFNFLCGGGRSFPVLAGVHPTRFASVGYMFRVSYILSVAW